MQNWENISLWMDQLDKPLLARPSLEQDLDVDVAIIGAGYSGLWTAYYLKRRAPQLRIVILEAQTTGYGASGRNGGWLMGRMLGEDRYLAPLPKDERMQAYAVLKSIPDEVAGVIQAEGIDCGYLKGGVLTCAARYPEQRSRLRHELDELYREGHDESDYVWLDRHALDAHMRIADAYGAIYSPHCATIQPARLVRGLAQAVERLGVSIYERSPVSDWQPRELRTARGRVRADWIVPAVEGYAGSLGLLQPYQVAVQSLIVATEPLSASTWDEIGLRDGQAFAENSRQITYGHRTRDDRLVFGARGGYRFGGRVREDFQLTEAEIQLRRYLFESLFPSLRGAKLSHAWGGNMGMARRFRPHMLRDEKNGLALAGGFGGEGVGATNLGGRTVAYLILHNDSALTRLPWVTRDQPLGKSLRRWEPEPCRWLGYQLIMRSFASEDRVLANPATPPWRRRLARSIAAYLDTFMH